MILRSTLVSSPHLYYYYYITIYYHTRLQLILVVLSLGRIRPEKQFTRVGMCLTLLVGWINVCVSDLVLTIMFI